MSMKSDDSGVPNARRRLIDGGAETVDELAMAALLAKVPPVTSDDLAAERVWRRVVATGAESSNRPLLSRVPRFAWIPAIAVMALVMMLVVRPGTTRSSAELVLSTGGVFSGKLAETWRPSQAGDPLTETERIRTDATGRAMLRVNGVAAVLLREGGDVSLERLHHGTLLRLSRGTLTARVSKRSPGEPFVVVTDRFTVTVVGTLFTVEQGPDERTVVSVREGVVEVSDGAGRVDRVVAGQRWVSESRDARTVDRTPDAVKALLEEGLAGKGTAELGGAFDAVVGKPVHGSNAALAASATQVGHTLPSDAPSADPRRGSPSGLPATSGGAEGGARGLGTRSSFPVAPAQGPDLFAPVPPAPGAIESPALQAPVPSVAPGASAAPAVVSPSLPSASSVSPPPSAEAVAPPVDQGAYARGVALEAKGDLEPAARELSRAATEDPAHADIALYALGRLAQRRLHDPARARAAFTAYRDRYPRGPLLPEVDLAILEIEVDTHAAAAALADSARFLAAHPASERVDEVHLLRGNLLRDADRCREALGDYAAVHALPWSDHALYSTAYCQRNLGDRTTAAATLHDYLNRFPAGAHRAEAQRALAEE